MIRSSIVVCVTFAVCTAAAQELPQLRERRAEYNILIDAKSDEEALPFVLEWTAGRKATVSQTSDAVSSLGRHFELESLTTDDIFSKGLRGGLQAESNLLLDRPRDIAAVALRGDREQRSEFADEMWHIDQIDTWFRENLNPNRRESLAVLEKWASSRAAFAEDFAAKRVALNKQAKFRVIADTIDPKNRAPSPGYEVMFVLELWEDYPQQHRPFPKFSTPSAHVIGPGRYVFYCRRKKDSGDEFVEGPRRRLYIAADTPFDLLIPRP